MNWQIIFNIYKNSGLRLLNMQKLDLDEISIRDCKKWRKYESENVRRC